MEEISLKNLFKILQMISQPTVAIIMAIASIKIWKSFYMLDMVKILDSHLLRYYQPKALGNNKIIIFLFWRDFIIRVKVYSFMLIMKTNR